MKTYIGTKIINAVPMNRADYNAFRDWQLPADENGADEGYLVEYTDGDAPNTGQYAGYVSWSPKAQFEAAYLPTGDVSGMPAHQQRVVAEKAALDDKAKALSSFIGISPIFGKLDPAEQGRLREQNDVMWKYSEILGARIAAFGAAA